MNNSEYTIDRIETFERLSEIENDWKRLFNLRKEIPLFFSFEVFKLYYETIIRNFNNVKIVIFVIKNKNHKTVAIFPFTFESKIYLYFLPIKELSIKDQYLIGFYNFLIDPKEDPDIIFQIFIKYLKKQKKSWNIIKFYSIPADEKLFKVCASSFTKHYKTDEDETATLVIDCDRTFDEYIKNDVQGKDNREVRRKMLRLRELGELKFIEKGEEQNVEEMLPHFYDIEDKSWKGREGTSLKRSYYGEFYKKLAIYFSKENKFRLYLLQLNNEYIAGVYAIIDQGICYLLKIGYVDDYYKYSPSQVLNYLLFENLFENKESKKIDFFGPYYDYQKFFGKQTRKKYNFTVYNNRALSYVYLVILKVQNMFIHFLPEKSLRGKQFKKLANIIK